MKITGRKGFSGGSIPPPAIIQKTKGAFIMTRFNFTKNTITVDGATYPAEYNIIDSGSVLVFAVVGVEADGYKHKRRFRFSPDYPEYSAALLAARGIDRVVESECAEIIPNPISESKKEESSSNESKTERRESISVSEKARDPKTARGPVPDKTFAGSQINGNGWKILFDERTARTRVIFNSAPTDAARAAVETAGFYYSRALNSWNKKLTWKAYRAAQALSGTLSKLYAA